jgi:uncharacterized membrane protein YeaQ/YmgE (transglycosylase-associated protein family)
MSLETILNNTYINQFLIWAGLGLGIGVAAKLILPGNENIGWIRTILFGLTGCFVGNFLAPRLFDWPTYSAFSWPGFGIGVAATLILVVTNRIITQS